MSATDDHSGWWSRAACRSADPELFFPISLSGSSAGEIDKAKAVCAKCAVRSHCLAAALALGHVQGIWGGTTEEERQRLRRQGDGPQALAAERETGSAGPASRNPRG